MTTTVAPALIALYTAGVRRAVSAHASDQAHEAGICTACFTNRRQLQSRRCKGCVNAGVIEGAKYPRGSSPRGSRVGTPMPRAAGVEANPHHVSAPAPASASPGRGEASWARGIWP